jgi:NADH:ubiquinone oxidoreductase subunit K
MTPIPMTSTIDLVNTSLSVSLFVLGLICLLIRRNVARQVIGLKVMLQGVCLHLIHAGRLQDNIHTSQMMVLSALIVEAVVIAVALALLVNVFHHYPSGDIDDLDRLKG